MKPQTERHRKVEIIQFHTRRVRLPRRIRRALHGHINAAVASLRVECSKCKQRVPRYYADARPVCFDCHMIDLERAAGELAAFESARTPKIVRQCAILNWLGYPVTPLGVHWLIANLIGQAWESYERELQPEEIMPSVLNPSGAPVPEDSLAEFPPRPSPQTQQNEYLMRAGIVDDSPPGPTAETVDVEVEIFRLSGFLVPETWSEDEIWDCYRGIDRCLASYHRAAGIVDPEND